MTVGNMRLCSCLINYAIRVFTNGLISAQDVKSSPHSYTVPYVGEGIYLEYGAEVRTLMA